MVQAEPGLARELSDFFTFFVPGYRFMPSYRNKIWDGKIRLYNLSNKHLYSGLIDYVEKFAQEREYKIDYKTNPKIVNGYNENDYESFINILPKKSVIAIRPFFAGQGFFDGYDVNEMLEYNLKNKKIDKIILGVTEKKHLNNLINFFD